MQSLFIEKCSNLDWKSLQEVAVKTFRATYEHKNEAVHFEKYVAKSFCDKQIKSELKNPKTHFFFVKIEAEIVGYFKLNEAGSQSDLNKPNTLEIERIYVYEKFKGKGIGRKMIEFSSAFAKKHGLTELWLGVWEQNPAAIAFYKKMGFEKFGTHSFMMGEEEQTDFLLKMEIV